MGPNEVGRERRSAAGVVIDIFPQGEAKKEELSKEAQKLFEEARDAFEKVYQLAKQAEGNSK